tara:strand:- start:119 stop:565 length:447 start_codon:yes stop_codon:yes gene_type:complete
MENIIKKILREQVSGKERVRQMAIDALFKAYVVDTKRTMIDATLRDMNMFQPKARDILENIYGISKDNDPELFNDIINTWISNVLGVPKLGSTIRIINMEDAQGPPPGTLGVVWGYNDTPWETQLSVKWENGPDLDVIPSVDEYEVLS